MRVIPPPAAARRIAMLSSSVPAPSSTPGRTCECRSIIARRRSGGCRLRRARTACVEQLLHAQGVTNGEELPVVVEVREHLRLTAPVFQTARPLPQLGVAVVAAAATRPVVEPDERPRRGEHVRLELLHFRAVADHERGAVRAQQCVDLLCEPARMAELEAVALLARQSCKRVREPLVVALERRWKLPEDRPHLRAVEQRLEPLGETLEPGAELEQALDVREVPRSLDREEEARRRDALPVGDGVAAGQPVEGAVDLDRVEVPRVVLEPRARREAAVELVLPAGVVPAGAAYADRAAATCVHSSAVPAAAMRERPSRPSSRQRSCAAAMSTERA